MVPSFMLDAFLLTFRFAHKLWKSVSNGLFLASNFFPALCVLSIWLLPFLDFLEWMPVFFPRNLPSFTFTLFSSFASYIVTMWRFLDVINFSRIPYSVFTDAFFCIWRISFNDLHFFWVHFHLAFQLNFSKLERLFEFTSFISSEFVQLLISDI